MENKTGKEVWNDEIDWTKPFKCPVCGKSFTLTLDNYNFHGDDIVAHHNCPYCHSQWHSIYKFEHLNVAHDGIYVREQVINEHVKAVKRCLS